MTKKRFKLHIEWYNKEKTEGEATLYEMGQPLGVIESIEDARLIRNILNSLDEEKKKFEKQVFEQNILINDYTRGNRKLQKENEQLKQQNQRWEHIACAGIHYNDILRKKSGENE